MKENERARENRLNPADESESESESESERERERERLSERGDSLN